MAGGSVALLLAEACVERGPGCEHPGYVKPHPSPLQDRMWHSYKQIFREAGIKVQGCLTTWSLSTAGRNMQSDIDVRILKHEIVPVEDTLGPERVEDG